MAQIHRKVRIGFVFAIVLAALSAWPQGSLPPARAEAPSRDDGTPSAIRIVMSSIDLVARELAYDPYNNRIYASIPSSVGVGGNSIVAINLPTLSVGAPVFVGSEPNQLALSDDGQYLYVGLDGAYGVRRFNVATQLPDLQFSLGTGLCGSLQVEDMVVLEGQPHAVAISLKQSCSPRHGGVAVYDDGVAREVMTPWHTGSNVIEPSEFDAVLYGYNNETTEFGLRTMVVDPSGIRVTERRTGLFEGFLVDIRFDKGFLYSTNGVVVDTHTMARVGTYDLGTYNEGGLVLPDSASGHVYFVVGDPQGETRLIIFDQATFLPLARVSLPGIRGFPWSLIKAGENRMAFRTTNGKVVLLTFPQMNKAVHLPLVCR